MRPLIAERGPAPHPQSHRDPAPSRWAYRWERLWLRPAFRRFVRTGLPVIAVLALAGAWAASPGNLRAVTDVLAELRRQIEARPEFQVTVVGIDGASPVLSDEIRLVLGIDLPISSFDLDLAALRMRLIALPAVAEADLRIEAGGYLAVNIVERQPALVWQTRGGAVLLDDTGVFVAALQDRPGIAPLPQIAGEGADLAAAEAMGLLDQARALNTDLRGLVRVGERRWDLVLADGRRVQLPSQGAAAALDRLIVLNAAQDLLARDILRIDMRNPDRLSLQLSDAALAELRRARDFAAQAQGGAP